jgi:hypothetical protein
MKQGYWSYCAGYNDTLTMLDSPIEKFGESVFQYPDQDNGELDADQYLRGQVEAIIKTLAFERNQ